MKAELMEIGIKAKEAAGKMALLETNKKNEVFKLCCKESDQRCKDTDRRKCKGHGGRKSERNAGRTLRPSLIN